jgi:hypothetical protein
MQTRASISKPAEHCLFSYSGIVPQSLTGLYQVYNLTVAGIVEKKLTLVLLIYSTENITRKIQFAVN